MSVFNLKTTALALVAGVSLAGCAYGPYGGVGVGYNNGYYDPYYNGSYYGGRYYSGGYGYPYGGYGYGYGAPYYGWYNGFYYPGTGYYVYDRDRRAHRWTDAQRRYWERRRAGSTTTSRGTAGILENWADFQNGQQANTAVRQRTVERQQILRSRPVSQQVESAQREERRAARAEAKQQQRRSNNGRNRRVDND